MALASLLRMARLDWPMPDASTLCRMHKCLTIRNPYRRASGPLNLLVDSTGINFLERVGSVVPERPHKLNEREWQLRTAGVRIALMDCFSALGTAAIVLVA